MVDTSTTEMSSSIERFRIALAFVSPSHACKRNAVDDNDGDDDGNCIYYCNRLLLHGVTTLPQ